MFSGPLRSTGRRLCSSVQAIPGVSEINWQQLPSRTDWGEGGGRRYAKPHTNQKRKDWTEMWNLGTALGKVSTKWSSSKSWGKEGRKVTGTQTWTSEKLILTCSWNCLEKFFRFWREDRSRRALSVQDWLREYLNCLGVQYIECHRMHLQMLRDLASVTVWKLMVIWGYSWDQRERKHHCSLQEEQNNWFQLSSCGGDGTPNPGDHFWVKIRTRRWLGVASMALQSRKHTWQNSLHSIPEWLGQRTKREQWILFILTLSRLGTVSHNILIWSWWNMGSLSGKLGGLKTAWTIKLIGDTKPVWRPIVSDITQELVLRLILF